MSLLSKFILPIFEKELIALEPVVANFILNEVHMAGTTVLNWIETKGKAAANAEPDRHEEEE